MELNITIIHNSPRNTLEPYYLSKEQISDVGCIIGFMTRYEMCHLRKPINNHKNRIATFP
jgi:hypothetical protein